MFVRSWIRYSFLHFRTAITSCASRTNLPANLLCLEILQYRAVVFKCSFDRLHLLID